MSAVWEKRARFYDLFEGSDLRRGRAKAELFRRMEGRVLFVAVGTGLDVKHFPPNLEIIAIDISDAMLRRAAPCCRRYAGNLRLVQGTRSICASLTTRSIPLSPPAQCVQYLTQNKRWKNFTGCCAPAGSY